METLTIALLGGALLLESLALLSMYRSMSSTEKGREQLEAYVQKVVQEARGYAQLVSDVVSSIPKRNLKAINKGLLEKGFEIVNEIPVDEEGNKLTDEKCNIIKSVPKDGENETRE